MILDLLYLLLKQKNHHCFTSFYVKRKKLEGYKWFGNESIMGANVSEILNLPLCPNIRSHGYQKCKNFNLTMHDKGWTLVEAEANDLLNHFSISSADNTWEPEENCIECREIIEEFETRRKKKELRKKKADEAKQPYIFQIDVSWLLSWLCSSIWTRLHEAPVNLLFRCERLFNNS